MHTTVSNSAKDSFLRQVTFNKSLFGYCGAELEGYTIDKRTGLLVPRAAELLEMLPTEKYCQEIGACEIEMKTGPNKDANSLIKDIESKINYAREQANCLGLDLTIMGVGPKNIPLIVAPNKRYHEITKDYPEDKLRAFLRVEALHFHFGCKNWEDTIYRFNLAVDAYDKLFEESFNHCPERLNLYYQYIYYRPRPKKIFCKDDLWDNALLFGYSTDIGQNWALIRITIHGTIEFRMFPATEDITLIKKWYQMCHKAIFPEFY